MQTPRAAKRVHYRSSHSLTLPTQEQLDIVKETNDGKMVMNRVDKLVEVLQGYQLGWNHSKLVRLQNLLEGTGVSLGGVVSGTDQLIVKYQSSGIWVRLMPEQLINPETTTWDISLEGSNDKFETKYHPIFEAEEVVKELAI